MYDKSLVLLGILAFLLIFTSPFWLNYAIGAREPAPKLVIGTDEPDCVEPLEYMKAYHMDLLNTWRDKAVREGKRLYTASDGQAYQISLTNTCLDCHSDTEGFCNRCHDYSAVEPTCWDCHHQEKENLNE